MAKRLTAKTKCQVYASSFKNLNMTTYGTNADLIMPKSRGYLSHPNSNLFTIIKLLELSVDKFKDSPNVFEEAFEDLKKKKILNLFVKNTKKNSITRYVYNVYYIYYIVMRMRQYTYIQNQNSKKLNTTKKKLSKLVIT